MMRIKVEINTHETSPSSPLQRLPSAVENAWFSGGADVLTFATPELFATKIRLFINGWNDRCHPFVWTKTADQILKKANRTKNSTTDH